MNHRNLAGRRGRKWTPQTDPPRRIGAKNDASLAPTRENAKDRNIFNQNVPNAHPESNKLAASHRSPTTTPQVSVANPQQPALDEVVKTAGIPGSLLGAVSLHPLAARRAGMRLKAVCTSQAKGVARAK